MTIRQVILYRANFDGEEHHCSGNPGLCDVMVEVFGAAAVNGMGPAVGQNGAKVAKGKTLLDPIIGLRTQCLYHPTG